MATFITIKNKIGKKYYYSKIQNKDWGTRFKRVSLGDNYVVARKRHRVIEKDFEKEIKQGVEFNAYGWEIGSKGKVVIKKTNLGQTIDEWLEVKKVNVSDTSYRRYAISLRAFTNVIGRTSPRSSINNKSFELFKRQRKLYPNTPWAARRTAA